MGPRAAEYLVFNIVNGSGLDTEMFAAQFLRYMGLDPLSYILKSLGIGNYDTVGEITGENHFIRSELHRYIDATAPVFVDVGGNTGAFARKLNASFPFATIYSFEPNPETYRQLVIEAENSAIRPIQAACGSTVGTKRLFTYADELVSEHATTHPQVLQYLHKRDHLVDYEVPATTLDEFCSNHSITHIHFLKVDTEGDEFDVLLGASRLIQEDRLTAIQFEFNEMNVISRVFLRDFFVLLDGFDIFRLLPNGLLPLGQYSSNYEIFRYQNFIALRHAG